LKQLVSQQCLDDISLDIEYYDCIHNKEVLAGQTWLDIVRTQKSLIITVSVVEKEQRESPELDNYLSVITRLGRRGNRPNSSGRGTNATTSEIESSSSSTDDDIELSLAQVNRRHSRASSTHDLRNNQLIIIRPYGSPSPRTKSKERRLNIEKIQKLTRSGLIVNEPESVAVKKKVKMYRLEPEIKLSDSQPQDKDSLLNESSVRPNQSSKQAYVDEEAGSIPQGLASGVDVDGKKSQPQARKPAKTPKLALRAPPFFTWNLEGSTGKTDEMKPPHYSSESTGLKHILSRLESKIAKSDYDLVGHRSHGFHEEASFGGGRFYDETPSLGLDELEMLKKPLSETLHNLRHRCSLIMLGFQLGTSASSSSKPDFVRKSRSEEDDPFVLQQKIDLHNNLQSMLSLAEDLIACFTPRSYDHSLLRKIMGGSGIIHYSECHPP
jgi:hypothetical protein